jgi:hypothetical protein
MTVERVALMIRDRDQQLVSVAIAATSFFDHWPIANDIAPRDAFRTPGAFRMGVSVCC